MIQVTAVCYSKLAAASSLPSPSQLVMQGDNTHSTENSPGTDVITVKIFHSSKEGSFETNLSAKLKRLIIHLVSDQPKVPFPKDREG